MSSFFLGWAARLGRLLITRGLGYDDDEPPPPVTTTQGCIQSRVLTPASILTSTRPASLIETRADAAAVIETRVLTPASILTSYRPAALIETRVVAC